MAILGTYQKQPNEQETIEIDLSNRISSLVVSGYVINSVDMTIFDGTGIDVTSTMLQGTPSYSGSSIFGTIKAGTTGETYYLKSETTLTQALYPDQIIEGDLRIYVLEEDE